jgi:DNA-binding SARP family transcriptional activator
MGAPLDAAAGGARRRRPAAPASAVRLTLLNSFGLVYDGTPVRLPLSAQRLLAFVALKRHPVHRPYAAGSLWPASSERGAAASLRSALWRLRRAGREVLAAEGQQVRLAPTVRVDLHEAEKMAAGVLDGSGEISLGVGLDELRSDLLPDWYDDWVLMEREYFRQLRLRALEVACDRLTDAGKLDEALSAGLAALECEPLRESAHRALVRVHLAQGNVFEAVRQYTFCRSLLEEHVGVAPSEGLTDMIREVMGRQQIGDALVRTIPGKGRAA